MKNITTLIPLAMAAVLAVSCHKDDPGEEAKIPIRISSTVSKVSEDSFVAGDAVGLYVVNAVETSGDSWTSAELKPSGNHLDNVKFTYKGAGFESSQPYYWKDARTKADFYCYYPYTSGVQDVSAVPFSLVSDQSTKAAFESCEILWGRTVLATPTDKGVAILSLHRCGQLVIEVRPGKGFDAASLAASLNGVKVRGVRLDAKLNLTDGSLAADGAASDVTPYFDGTYYRIMLPPQRIENAALVTLTVDGQERTLVQTVDFTSNSRKKCTITVDKLSEGINVSIGGWEDDGNDYGGTLN